MAISTASSLKRAKDLVGRRLRLGTPRKEAKPKNIICSLGTANAYAYCLLLYFEWLTFNSIDVCEQDHATHILNYLEDCSEGYKQSTLNQHRQALKVTFHQNKLPMFKSEIESRNYTRSYPWPHVEQIVKYQNDENALATIIAYSAGLRAHELATLRLATELPPSNHRPWRDDLFAGLPDFIHYVVVGKGGLRRQVAIPAHLSEILESRRCLPETVIDRRIQYEKIYSIGFGHSFSSSFSRASKIALGRSTGAHGLRHSYAKRRFKKLLDMDFELSDALLILSQELGHFRPCITWCYLR